MGVACLALFTSCAVFEPLPEPKPFPKDAFEWSASSARVGEKFAADLKAKKPIATPYRVAFCRIDEGELPPGLRQDLDHVEGTPLQAGEWSMVFRVQLTVGPEERRVVQYVPWNVAVAPSIEAKKAKAEAAPKVEAKCAPDPREAVLHEIREMRRIVKELRDLVRQIQNCIRAR
jgi:hypothetical protein